MRSIIFAFGIIALMLVLAACERLFLDKSLQQSAGNAVLLGGCLGRDRSTAVDVGLIVGRVVCSVT